MKSLLAVLLFAQLAGAWTHVGANLYGWPTRRLAVAVNTENCTVPDDVLLPLVDDAVNAWNGVHTIDLIVFRNPTPSTTTVDQILDQDVPDAPVIACDPNFESNNQVDGDSVPAATRIEDDDERRLNFAAILLNAQAGTDAEISQMTTDKLRVILAHEIGHVLGLGHSSERKALMYYSVADKVHAIITEDDAAGLTHLYPRSEFFASPFGCASIKYDGRRPLRSDGAILFISLIALSVLLGRIVVFRRAA